MHLPKHCVLCFAHQYFQNLEYGQCKIMGWKTEKEGRPDWCPLKEGQLKLDGRDMKMIR